MRPIVLAAFLCAIASPAAAESSAPDWAVVQTLPCRTFVASFNTQLLSYLQDPIVDVIGKRSRNPAAFGSACNIGDYVRKVCEAHGRFTIGVAVTYLLDLQTKGRALPAIPRCGA